MKLDRQRVNSTITQYGIEAVGNGSSYITNSMFVTGYRITAALKRNIRSQRFVRRH